MKRLTLLALAALALAACRQEDDLPLPAAMTDETLGHYCQMILVNHVGPKGQVHLDGEAAPLFFAQVRDALGYLHMPEQSHAVRAVYVQDMAGASWDAPGEWIRADTAFYIVGSDRRGGMGAPEVVPFSDETAARRFMAEHGGTLRRFDAVAAADVLSDDTPATGHAGDIADRLEHLSHAHESH